MDVCVSAVGVGLCSRDCGKQTSSGASRMFWHNSSLMKRLTFSNGQIVCTQSNPNDFDAAAVCFNIIIEHARVLVKVG